MDDAVPACGASCAQTDDDRVAAMTAAKVAVRVTSFRIIEFFIDLMFWFYSDFLGRRVVVATVGGNNIPRGTTGQCDSVNARKQTMHVHKPFNQTIQSVVTQGLLEFKTKAISCCRSGNSFRAHRHFETGRFIRHGTGSFNFENNGRGKWYFRRTSDRETVRLLLPLQLAIVTEQLHRPDRRAVKCRIRAE